MKSKQVIAAPVVQPFFYMLPVGNWGNIIKTGPLGLRFYRSQDLGHPIRKKKKKEKETHQLTLAENKGNMKLVIKE